VPAGANVRAMNSFKVLALMAALLLGGCVLLGPGANSDDDHDEELVFHDGVVSPGNGHDAGQQDAGPACPEPTRDHWTVDGLALEVGEIPYDYVSGFYMTLGTGGCLKEVYLTVSLGDDSECQLSATAGPYVDAAGRLIVSDLSLTGTGPCPGFPDAARGVFSAIDDSGFGVNASDVTATLAFVGDTCKPDTFSSLDWHCLSGTFDLALHGAVSEGLAFPSFGDDAGVSDPDPGLVLEGAHLKIAGYACGFLTGDAPCPKVLAD
jgi:hypothetical protein